MTLPDTATTPPLRANFVKAVSVITDLSLSGFSFIFFSGAFLFGLS
jgi:hypothetical protein